MAYLTYITENYDSLPDIVAFIYSHRTAWYTNDQKMNSPEVLKWIQRDFVRQ